MYIASSQFYEHECIMRVDKYTQRPCLELQIHSVMVASLSDPYYRVFTTAIMLFFSFSIGLHAERAWEGNRSAEDNR